MNETIPYRLLAAFMGEDKDQSRAALETLWQYSYPSLIRYMKSRYASPGYVDCEDVVQEAFSKIWLARSRFKDQGPAAWHKFIQTVAVRCYLDHCTGLKQSLKHVNIDSIPDNEIIQVADVFEAIQQTETIRHIYHAADILWLGVTPHLTSEQLTRRVLAAKWFYLEGASWQEVIELMGPGAFDEPTLTQHTLDDWLMDKGVLLTLCFEELYFSNDRLTWQMLGFAEPVHLDKLNALSREVSLGALSEEANVIIWHYRYGKRLEDIAGHTLGALNNEKLLALTASLASRLPFKNKMEHLLDNLGQTSSLQARDILCATGLWQRLAFQYSYADELIQPDIHARLRPAADLVDYHLTPGMLNVWLSNKRLLNRLVKYYSQYREGQFDD